MNILNTIRTLESLEAHGALDPKTAIQRNGFEKVVEVLEIYKKAQAWGVPAEHLREIFSLLTGSAEDVAPTPSFDESEAPQIEIASDEAPVSEPLAEDTSSDRFFGSSSSLHEMLRSVSITGTLKISNLELCTLFGASPSQGNLRKITQVFDQNGMEGELSSDPARITRTRSRFYMINLDEWVDNGSFKDLWSYLRNKSEKEAIGMCLPIAFYDYLDGTELGMRFRNSEGDLSLVVSNKTYNSFVREVRLVLKRVYGESAPSGNMVDNTSFNRYLLSRALRMAYPKTTLKEMISEAQVKDAEVAESYVRGCLENVQVSLDIFDDTWATIDTTLSGFVYLLAQMFLDYYIESGSRF